MKNNLKCKTGGHEWVQEANWEDEKIQYRCMWCNEVPKLVFRIPES